MAGRERRLVVMSDIEMGAGGPVDDFPHDAWLGALIQERAAVDDAPVDLIFNGDTFDFLKTSVGDAWPRHIDAGVAVRKLARIHAAHPRFFEAVAAVLAWRPDNRAVFVVGNHDLEVQFPEVQAGIRSLLGQAGREEAEQVYFPGVAWQVGDVHVEHGQQTDVIFAVEPDQPFIEQDGRRLLNLPWGAVALLDVTMPMAPVLYAFDRLQPRGRVLELLPDAKELLLQSFWTYWTREYLPRAWRREDPLTRLSWPMLKEIAYRFGTASTRVSSGSHWKQALKDSDDVRLIILGHEHRAEWWTWSDRKLLRDGCLRDEYVLMPDGRIGERLPKVWAEARLRDGRVVESRLVEREAPRGDFGTMPRNVFDLLPAVRAQLARYAGAEEERVARSRQDRLEPHAGDENLETRDHPSRSLREASREDEG